jgi:hypothetical protein
MDCIARRAHTTPHPQSFPSGDRGGCVQPVRGLSARGGPGGLPVVPWTGRPPPPAHQPQRKSGCAAAAGGQCASWQAPLGGFGSLVWQKTDFPANRGPFLPDRRGALEEGGRTVRGEIATLKRKVANSPTVVSPCVPSTCVFSVGEIATLPLSRAVRTGRHGQHRPRASLACRLAGFPATRTFPAKAPLGGRGSKDTRTPTDLTDTQAPAPEAGCGGPFPAGRDIRCPEQRPASVLREGTQSLRSLLAVSQ